MKIKDGTLIKGKNSKKVKIPKRVTTIGEKAFKDCDKIEEIILPEGLKVIGDRAFENCAFLRTIVIPDSVTKIGKYGFAGCTSLESIILSNNLTCIMSDTFEDCTSLKEIVIPNSVTSIGEYAFNSCTSLKEVKIPNGVTSIKTRTFCNCKSLGKVELPEGLKTIEYNVFQYCSSLKTIEIPNSVTEIGEEAFVGCKSLEKIKLSEGIISIGEGVFQNCHSLREIKIPESVAYIENHTFEGCIKLENITLPEGIIWIGDYAFNCCESLKELTLSDKIKYIGEYAFNCCYNLKLTIKTSLFTFKNRKIVNSTDSATFWIKQLYINNELVIPNKNIDTTIDKIRKQELLDKIKNKLLENNIKNDIYFTYDEHKNFIDMMIFNFNRKCFIVLGSRIKIYMEDREDFDRYISEYINKIKKGYIPKQIEQLNLSNQSSSKLLNTQSNSISSIPQEVSQDSYKTIPNNKFIQIIYNEKLCNIPLDFDILRCIEQQDDVEITFENNYIVRDDDKNAKTFKINNALRRAYLIRLSRLDISEELKEYLKRYDVYIEYIDMTSITSVKTMVNELGIIYYLETKYKNDNTKGKNNNKKLVEEPLNNVRLDKGLDKQLVKKIEYED